VVSEPRVVFKYPLDLGPSRIPWTPSSRVLLVQAQHASDDLPTVWVEHPYPLSEGRGRWFEVVGTGHPFPPGSAHVGSAVCAEGSLVWHIYGEQP
jgi:hypothetical protein